MDGKSFHIGPESLNLKQKRRLSTQETVHVSENGIELDTPRVTLSKHSPCI